MNDMNKQLNAQELLERIYTQERQRISALSTSHTMPGEYDSPVFGDGRIGAPVLFIGEAPGSQEVLEGRPFVGKAGQQLNNMLAIANIDRNDVYVTNAVKYRPVTIRLASSGRESLSNRTPMRDEILASIPALRCELMALKPELIATLGNTPLQSIWTMLHLSEPCPLIGSVHGKPQHIVNEKLSLSFILYPLYHPASGIYNKKLLPIMESDLVNMSKYCHSLLKR